jgi:HD-GYP domain-containing protein (c-di-GMP phosphodiesterase class II)
MDEGDLRLLGRQALYRLAVVAERRSGFAGHSRRTSALADVVAGQLALTETRRDLLRQASILHDIGKVAIPDRILCKAGALDREEREVVETHTEIGHWLLAGRGCPVLDLAAEIALHHHESLDGSGYPSRLTEEEILLEVRIVTVCDVFDALTSDRPYRPSFTDAAALEIITPDSGNKYDPDVIDALIAAIPDWEHAGVRAA